MSLIPRDLRDEVCSLITVEADRLDWEHLPQQRKSAMLSDWSSRPDIGGRLAPLLGTDAQVRGWLKDVALKRRSRDRGPDPELIVKRSLGEGFTVVPDTIGIKPPHCLAGSADETVYVCWGPPGQAKHLYWASMNAVADVKTVSRACVVLASPVAGSTPADHRARLDWLAKRCDVDVRWVSLT